MELFLGSSRLDERQMGSMKASVNSNTTPDHRYAEISGWVNITPRAQVDAVGIPPYLPHPKNLTTRL